MAWLVPRTLALMRPTTSSTLNAPLRSISWREITCTGSAVSASMRGICEPVTTMRCAALSVSCASEGATPATRQNEIDSAQERCALHLPEQVRMGRAHWQCLLVALEPQLECAIDLAVHRGDLVDVDDRAAVHLPEHLGVELGCELGNRLADQRFAFGRDDQGVLAVRLEEDHLLHGDEPDVLPLRRAHPAQMALRRRVALRERVEQAAQVGGLAVDALLQPSHRRRQPHR